MGFEEDSLIFVHMPNEYQIKSVPFVIYKLYIYVFRMITNISLAVSSVDLVDFLL